MSLFSSRTHTILRSDTSDIILSIFFSSSADKFLPSKEIAILALLKNFDAFLNLSETLSSNSSKGISLSRNTVIPLLLPLIMTELSKALTSHFIFLFL